MINSLTAFIAAIVACIALLQWITARQKVVLDLFDKRFEVYEDLREAINEYLTQTTTYRVRERGGVWTGTPNYIGKFGRAADRARFLFGPEITRFLEARRMDLNDDFFDSNRPETEVPEIPEDRRKAREDRRVAREDRLVHFFEDFDVLVAPYMKHTQKRVRIPYIDP
jgi:hypothetical protein